MTINDILSSDEETHLESSFGKSAGADCPESVKICSVCAISWMCSPRHGLCEDPNRSPGAGSSRGCNKCSSSLAARRRTCQVETLLMTMHNSQTAPWRSSGTSNHFLALVVPGTLVCCRVGQI